MLAGLVLAYFGTQILLHTLVVERPSLTPSADAPRQQSKQEPLAAANLPLIGNDLYPFPLAPSNESIWKTSSVLPAWVKDYFQWHGEQRRLMTSENWSNFRFIVMACLRNDAKCGGSADRLQPLPFVLRMAAESNRILLIHWDVPAALEAFLLPPRGGVDWRLPEYMYEAVAQTPDVNVIRTAQTLVDRLNKIQDRIIVRTRIQSHTHGSDVYNARAIAMNEPPTAWHKHFHDIWYTFFTPVPNIAKSIEDHMEQLELVPGGFSYAHIRALYEINPGEANIKKWAENAINCLSEITLKGGPFFVASDSPIAKQAAVAYGERRKVRVVARNDSQPPLHVDRVQKVVARDLFPVFIDLYIMSFGEWCVTTAWFRLAVGSDLL